jgi:hypothetical protein
MIHIPLILGLVYWFQKKYAPELGKFYWIVFFIKCMAAVSLGLVYRYYYSTGDTWTYFEQAVQLSDLAHTDFNKYLQALFTNQDTSTVTHILYFHDRAFLFVKVVSIFSLITSGNYWLCATYFAVISFFSCWVLYQRAKEWLIGSSKAVALAVFFFPSILFWSSGLLKETLALAALYFLTSVFIKFAFSSKVSWAEWLLVLVSLFIGWSLKYYWMAIFLGVLLPSVVIIAINRVQKLTVVQWRAGWVVLFACTIILATFSHPNFYFERILSVLVASHDQSLLSSPSQSTIHYFNLQPTWSSLVLNSPWAFFSGAFRPLPWEAYNLASFVGSIENMVIVILTISFLISFRKTPTEFLVPIVVYAITLCVFLAISTPSLGTLSRYRVGFLPFFVFALAYRNTILEIRRFKTQNLGLRT